MNPSRTRRLQLRVHARPTWMVSEPALPYCPGRKCNGGVKRPYQAVVRSRRAIAVSVGSASRSATLQHAPLERAVGSSREPLQPARPVRAPASLRLRPAGRRRKHGSAAYRSPSEQSATRSHARRLLPRSAPPATAPPAASPAARQRRQHPPEAPSAPRPGSSRSARRLGRPPETGRAAEPRRPAQAWRRGSPMAEPAANSASSTRRAARR